MKTKLLVKSLLIAGLLAVVCGFPMQASALPLEPFSFHQHSGFLVESPYLWSTSGENSIGWYDSGSSPAPPAGEYDTLAWGSSLTGNGGLMGSDPWGNASYSGLRVIGYEATQASGSLKTGVDLGGGWSDWGGWVSISTIYHQNKPIPIAAATLSSAVIYSELYLDHGPDGDIFGSPNGIPIGFIETPNQLNFQGVCADGNPNNSVCDDMFTFPGGGFITDRFTYAGHDYEARFQLANFVDSSSNFIDYRSCPGGVCTVWTAEGVTSSMDVQMSIREVVPEPATLLLLGLGLLGLGFAKRRGIKS